MVGWKERRTHVSDGKVLSVSEFSGSEYSEYAKFMACTTAYYLDAKARYDPMSVFLSSKIDPVPYQIYDFNRLIEEYRKSGNIRALIAYETGLGKTILVGMIIKELLSPRFESGYHKHKRILILTPPAVLLQFSDEMKRKFGLEFERFDTKNPVFGDMVIASIETLKFSPWKERLREQVWDLIVVDEYHRINQFNLRGELIEVLTGKTKSFIALTATPHDGRSDRYGFRLNTIAPSPIIIRRTKREAIDINNRKLFDQDVFEIKEDFEVTPEELSFYSKAERYAKKRFEGTGAGALVAIVIGRAVSSSIRAGVKLLTRRRKKLLLEDFKDEGFEDLFDKVNEGYELSQEDIDTILSARPESRQALELELELLKPVIDEGERFIKDNPVDSKGKYLLGLLEKIKEEGRKCLIYTGFLETVDYLRELLEKEGYNPLEITGRVSMDERNRIVEKFSDDEINRVIIGTDAMGESLNLQAASVEVNYEVPWSPVSYIQRVGRIWRFGQKSHELFIHNFLPAFKVERRVMEVILEKIKIINEEFGEVGLSVFGEKLGSIDKLVKKAYSGEDVDEHVEDAFSKSVEIGKEVMEVLRNSMELPKVVNVEELQRNNIIDLDDAFSEEDLRRFLDYLRDAGVAVGVFPDEENGKSTYHIKLEGEYIRVERLSLEDKGINIAISLGMGMPKRFDFYFNHKKSMEGRLVIFETKVDGNTVYEEPVLVTPEGVLTYRGIMGLSPSFAEKVSNITLMPLDEYKSKTGDSWLVLSNTKWYDELRVKQNALLEENEDYRKEWLKGDLETWMLKKPKDVTVDEKQEICRVNFLGILDEETWRGRHEVEMIGMKAATCYYESRRYLVEDVSTQNRGYDIECRRADGILRVEVKGLKAMVSPLMTFNEHRMAEFYRDSFVLFIVKIEGDRYRMYEIPDPVSNLNITEIVKPVYKVTGYDDFQIYNEQTFT